MQADMRIGSSAKNASKARSKALQDLTVQAKWKAEAQQWTLESMEWRPQMQADHAVRLEYGHHPLTRQG